MRLEGKLKPNELGNNLSIGVLKVKNPVCGMAVDPKDAWITSLTDHLLLLQRGCLDEFKSDPAAFIGSTKSLKKIEETGKSLEAIYTCPHASRGQKSRARRLSHLRHVARASEDGRNESLARSCLI